jgi:hypothetical protein
VAARKGLDWAADMLARNQEVSHDPPSPSARRSPPASPCSRSSPPAPAHAQWIVFDPTNFSQNVLTAARELQQVNNEIQSLENQATC